MKDHVLRNIITSNRKFPCFYESRDAEISPETTSTDRPEQDHGHPDLFSGVDHEAQDPVHYDARGRWLATTLWHRNICEHVPCRQFQVVTHLVEPVFRPSHLQRESVRDSLEAEGWVSGEAGGDVGAVEEAAVVVLGVEEGDA